MGGRDGLEMRHHLLGWRELLAGLLGGLERVILLLSEFRGLLLERLQLLTNLRGSRGGVQAGVDEVGGLRALRTSSRAPARSPSSCSTTAEGT